MGGETRPALSEAGDAEGGTPGRRRWTRRHTVVAAAVAVALAGAAVWAGGWWGHPAGYRLAATERIGDYRLGSSDTRAQLLKDLPRALKRVEDPHLLGATYVRTDVSVTDPNRMVAVYAAWGGVADPRKAVDETWRALEEYPGMVREPIRADEFRPDGLDGAVLECARLSVMADTVTPACVWADGDSLAVVMPGTGDDLDVHAGVTATIRAGMRVEAG
ncbi:hypothetical protein AB0M28_34985 [Streptomyces sp. NPDC051940]|uniref:hypothetical protein n=1 Tax=Streptomyces sp. NPDC051940 TaxID=3155675 RepID=UPI0034279949